MKQKLVFILLLLLNFTLFSASARSQFVTVDGIKYWTETLGKGEPAIILISGAGDDTESWSALLPGLSHLSTVFTYDRAGIGKSTPLADHVSVRSAKYVVGRMREVLKASQIKAPYVLVGNGLGTLYARYFARQFPSEVQGMVLINPDVNAAIALGEIKDYPEGGKPAQGLYRRQFNTNLHNLRVQHNEFLRTTGKIGLNYKQAQRIERQLEVLGTAKSERQIRALPPLRDMPLVIIEGKQDSALETTMIKQIAAQTSKGHYVFTPLNSNALKKLAPESIISAVKKVL